MNFELLPFLTDYANYKKGGMKLKQNLFLEENHPMTISSKFCSY
jgi:hypothetical protein